MDEHEQCDKEDRPPVSTEPLRYLSQAALARRFAVTPPTITNWRNRYPEDGDRWPTPRPDAYVDDRPLWLEDSFSRWEEWRQRRRQPIASPETKQIIGKDGRATRMRRRRRTTAPEHTDRPDIVLGGEADETREHRRLLHRTLMGWYRRAGRPDLDQVAEESGLHRETVITAFQRDAGLPERASIVALAVALGGDADEAAQLWAAARPARKIDGGWLSRVLSARHSQVLTLAAAGNDTEAIAAALGWTVEGVQDYFDDITERLRVATIEQAVQVATEAGHLQFEGGVVKATTDRGRLRRQGGEHGYLVDLVAHRIRQDFADAEPGTALPAQQRLAERYETSLTTVSYAVKILRAEGFITGGGKGHPLVVAQQPQPEGPSWTTT